MLRKLLKYMIVVAAPLLAACSDDYVVDDTPADGNDMLTINLRSRNATRADSETDDSKNNEDAIKNVVIAFYPNEYGEGTEPLAVVRPGDYTLTGTNATTAVSVKMTPEMIDTLFSGNSGATCKFFALANLTDDEQKAIGVKPTIAQLKSLPISSDFATKDTQDMFVMSGSGTATYIKVTERNKYATGSGTLTRTAARISLSVTLDADKVTDSEGKEWTPLVNDDNIRVLLNKGVKNSIVTPTGKPGEADYYSVSLGEPDVVRKLNGPGNGPFTMSVPFYTYPNKWDNNNPEEQNRTSMTLVMRWQRTDEETGITTTRTYYYQVPVTPNDELVSNHSYHVSLTVGMLGSLTPDTPVKIENVNYQVVSWGSVNVDVEMNDTRYLIVNPTSFEINNEASFRIPFYSTHEVVITDISISYQLFNFYSGTQGELATITIDNDAIDASNKKAAAGEEFCTYDIKYDSTTSQYYIVINHPLKIYDPYDSSGSPISMKGHTYSETADEAATVSSKISYLTATTDVAFQPFTITVKIQQIGNSNFSDEVVITQYPGMYIKADTNPGGSYLSRFVTSQGGGNYTYGLMNYGYAYVNPTIETSGQYAGYIYNDEDLGGLRTTTSRNPNMYIVTITRLDDSKYIIGDPRSSSINNTLASPQNDPNGDLVQSTTAPAATSWCKSAPALYNEGEETERTLSFYYPTDESKSTENMVAPKFRIASQYGNLGRVNTHVNKQNARRRMATYQEQGYPAGRWRLPTKAELLYMINLQINGYIPNLFTLTSESGYMTAQGAFIYNSSEKKLEESTASTFYVRGIYDEWYWENEETYVLTEKQGGGYDFTYGDVPRNATRSANLIKAYNDKILGK